MDRGAGFFAILISVKQLDDYIIQYFPLIYGFFEIYSYSVDDKSYARENFCSFHGFSTNCESFPY